MSQDATIYKRALELASIFIIDNPVGMCSYPLPYRCNQVKSCKKPVHQRGQRKPVPSKGRKAEASEQTDEYPDCNQGGNK